MGHKPSYNRITFINLLYMINKSKDSIKLK